MKDAYYLCEKRKSKLYAVAGLAHADNQWIGCLAAAVDAFNSKGLFESSGGGNGTRRVCRGIVTDQKNFGGVTADFQWLTTNSLEVDIHQARRHAFRFGAESALAIYETVTADDLADTTPQQHN